MKWPVERDMVASAKIQWLVERGNVASGKGGQQLMVLLYILYFFFSSFLQFVQIHVHSTISLNMLKLSLKCMHAFIYVPESVN